MNDLERLHKLMGGVDVYQSLGWMQLQLAAGKDFPGGFRLAAFQVSFQSNALGIVLRLEEQQGGERFDLPISWAGVIQHRHGPQGHVLAEVPM